VQCGGDREPRKGQNLKLQKQLESSTGKGSPKSLGGTEAPGTLPGNPVFDKGGKTGEEVDREEEEWGVGVGREGLN